MKHFGIVLAVASIVAGGAYAGPVTINLGTAGAGGTSILNKNLQANGYIPCTTASNFSCPTTNGLTTALPSGNPTSFTNVLFNGIQVPFDIAPSNNGTSADIWAPGVSKTTPISTTIDVGSYNGSNAATSGLFAPDEIWTMLNDIYGTAGNQGITITLNGVEADGTTPITEIIDLTAGVDYRSFWGGSVPGTNNGIQCDVANIGTAMLGSNCTGQAAAAVPKTGTDSGYNSTNAGEGVTITVYNAAFVTHDTETTPANYFLDVQSINLGGMFLNGYLDSIMITDNNPSKDDLALSAVTVDATPEPGTIALFAAGLGGLLLFARKRSRTNA